MGITQFDDLLNSAYVEISDKRLFREVESEDFLVVGDIHGDLNSLEYAIKLREELDAKTLVLLGDYVDRGSRSIECVRRVAELILEDSDTIILRGNHEDRIIYSKYGYLEDLRKIGNDGLSSDKLFSKLPIALMSKNIIFAHGFVDHLTNGIEILQSLPSNATFNNIYTGKMIESHPEMVELIWNDPNFDGKLIGEKTSLRGPGTYEIGSDITSEYLKKYDKKLIIRAHTVLGEGHLYIQDNQVLSIFSAGSGYNITPHYAHINGDDIEIHTYE